MDDSQNEQEKYKSIILAALLHDIGEFWERTTKAREESSKNIIEKFSGKNKSNEGERDKHSFWSSLFIEKFNYLFTNYESISSLVCNHHEPKNLDELIISIADKLSSAEREKPEKSFARKDKFTTPLLSIFSEITLDEEPPPSKCYYRLGSLKLGKDIFPAKDVNTSDKDYQDLWEEFIKELSKIKQKDDIFTIYYLLEKYTWGIPSSLLKNEAQDISLFDHLRTTAAIAACIFKEGIKQDDLQNLEKALDKSDSLNKDEIKELEKERYILLGADLSGIQQHLYSISQPEAIPGVAKRLRGRSLYISEINECFARYILSQTDLPIANLLYCGGGNFHILLPKSSWDKVKELIEKIQDWLFNEFQGELGLTVKAVTFASKEFLNYGLLLRKLCDEIEEEKKNKFLIKIQTTLEDFLLPISDKERTFKEKGKRIDICKSCEKNVIDPQNEVKCFMCEFQEELGRKLPKPKVEYLSYDTKFLDFSNFSLDESKEETREEIYKLNSTENFIIEGKPSGFKFLSKTVPLANKEFKIEEIKKSYGKGDVLDFDTIAYLSKGDKRLGILRMDVDHLGLIFAIGFEGAKSDNRSISRISTLSRMLELFFAGYINNICEENFKEWKKQNKNENFDVENVSNIFYIVYSGGDDLFIIGPWDETIKLSKLINDKFKEYTCSNPNINLSAGIFLCKPKFPIKRFAPLTGEILSNSKSEGRKRISLFGETMLWNKENLDGPDSCFSELLDFGEKLFELVDRKRDKLPRGFIQRLLMIRKQRSCKDCKDGLNLKYMPDLLYAITRNVPKDYKIEIEGSEENLRMYFYSNLPKMMGKIRFPASYALLKSRKGW